MTQKTAKKAPSASALNQKKRDHDYREKWQNQREERLNAYAQEQEAHYKDRRDTHESWLTQNKEDRQRVRNEAAEIKKERDALKEECAKLKAELNAEKDALEAGKAIKTLMRSLYRTGEELNEEDRKSGRRLPMMWGPWGW